ncbi:MAG: ATP-binding protein [Oscillospiraceae bacterium]|jgi:DNA replication protein DnaC|nr:ATP-binding protein [Oscillospiraceae bacterium]
MKKYASELEMDYMRIREENAREAARRIGAAGERDPEIARLAKARGTRLRQTVRLILSEMGKPEEMNRSMDISAKLAAEFEAIGKELKLRLVSAGLPKDYLDPIYTCDICRDTGKIGFPNSAQCECAKRMVANKLLRDGGMGLVESETFAAFDRSVFADDPPTDGRGKSQREHMDWVRAGCERYADNFPNNAKPNMLFSGESGLGKTFLLNCIGNRLRERAIPSLRITSYDLLDQLRQNHIGGDRRAALEHLYETPLLMIDDLGSESIFENLSIPGLFQIVNERTSTGKHLIVSTNLTRTQFEARYTERISSRLFDTETGAVILFYGKDVRLRRRSAAQNNT